MVTYGRGGWNWNDIYNLPVFLRNFYIKEMTASSQTEQKPPQERKSNKNKVITPPYVKS
jgi:hypothetical protein